MEHENRLLLSAQAVARLLDIARSTLYAWDQEGRIPRPVKIGSRVYWRTEEMRRWIDAGCPLREKWKSLQTDA